MRLDHLKEERNNSNWHFMLLSCGLWTNDLNTHSFIQNERTNELCNDLARRNIAIQSTKNMYHHCCMTYTIKKIINTIHGKLCWQCEKKKKSEKNEKMIYSWMQAILLLYLPRTSIIIVISTILTYCNINTTGGGLFNQSSIINY